jgi:exodeoxyribonuclease V beta subunit
VYGVNGEHESTESVDTAQKNERALLLIGDPKQAIYGFRGADIHTYLQARRATAGRHHSLGTNFRSTRLLVDAVNAVFGWAEALWPGAAFRCGDGDGHDNPMPFAPVAARGRDEHLLLAGQRAGAMNWWWLAPDDADAVPATRYRQQLAQAAASQLVEWLSAVPRGDTGFLQPDGRIRPLRPRDIAVLVRDRKEADAIRQAMAVRGVASAYLSERESVFASREARDLSVWLEAVHSGGQARALRAALGTASLGRSHAWLDRLNHDEALWDEMVQRFRGYRQIWLAQGVLPMVRQLLHDFALPAAWLSAPASAFNGPRTLTNVLHLAEWLQTQAPLLGSAQALMRELARQIEHPDTGADAARLRLESDDDLIKVVTIHKSKGLEYPLVLLPFIGSWKTMPARGSLVLPTDDASANRRVNLDDRDEADRDLAELERQREDLRLLYVALTRARHAVWLGVAPLAVRGNSCQMHESALGYLLGGTQPRSGAAFEQQLRTLCEAHADCMRLLPAPVVSERRWSDAGAKRQHAIATRAVPPRHWQPWWIASYSALTGELLAGEADPVLAVLPAPEPSPGLTVEQGGDMRAIQKDGGVPRDNRLQKNGDSQIPLDHSGEWSPSEPESPASEQVFELALASQIDALWTLAQQEAREAALDGMDWDGLTREAARLAAPAQGVHAFARGAEVGTFWHELLQCAAMQGFARFAQSPAKLNELVARRARVRGWGEQALAIAQWLLDWLHAPLPLPAVQQGESLAPVSMRLVDMHPGHVQAELEFWLPVHDATATRIDAVVRAHVEPGWSRPALSPLQLRGMLKGYMDLVFEAPSKQTSMGGHALMEERASDDTGHGLGRFHVLDYKSNWLGHDDASYHPDALRAAALANRYDLQAALYLLALHRLLRTRIPDYDPARHLGGSLTWFLRGSAREGGSVWCCPVSVAMLDELDALFDPATAPGGQE